MSLWDDLSPFVSNRNAAQARPLALLRAAMRSHASGTALEIQASASADASLEGSMTWETVSATELAESIEPELPYGYGAFDIVFVNHALERSISPLTLMHEIYRVVKPGGRVVFVASNIRPNENGVYCSVTPAGFVRMAKLAGLEVQELHPGIDGRTLFERIFAGNPRETARYFSEESPLNQEIAEKLGAESKSARSINMRKLQFCGEYHAVCQRPDPNAGYEMANE